MKPRLAIITFPGNNCETESLRAGKRNGFECELIHWNEQDRNPDKNMKLSGFDAYFLIGGFTYEDRGRSGALAAREPLFDELRQEAQKGKIILGVCNGAQMIVESGLIPVGDNPTPFALAENIRRDEDGHVLGTGFYNDWIYLTLERKDTAFTNKVTGMLHIPMAHGEGRFTTIDDTARAALEHGSHVAFRYCDDDGMVSETFPVTPNGSLFATAMIVNKEGTIGALMPHPERFFDAFDGDQVFQSMFAWITAKKSPSTVIIGDFYILPYQEPEAFIHSSRCVILEKKLIITDNEAFSVSLSASKIAGQVVQLEKTILFEVCGLKNDLAPQQVLDTGLILNENKEVLVEKHHTVNKYGVLPYDDDAAKHLAEKLYQELGEEVSVRILKCWNFGDCDDEIVEKVLQSRLLANPNSAEIFRV